jgi:pimeloyl-ACP methyl ester carboxylesterase
VTPLERRRFRSSGGELSYLDGGEGEPVVLLHGFPLSSHLWRDVAPALARRFRVVVPDLLGYGDSDMPDDVPLGVDAQAGYVRELLEALGVGRVAVVGHADGGGVAQRLALDGAEVAALVLIDAIAFDAWPVPTTREVQAIDPARLAPEILVAGIRTGLRTGVADEASIDDATVEAYAAPWLVDGGAAALVRAARALDGEGLDGRDAAFAAWGFPVLILWGEDDAFVPVEVAERLHDAMPSSSLALLPGVGHFAVEEAGPTVATTLVEWLRVRYEGATHAHGDPHGRVVALQLERRPPWVDVADDGDDDGGDDGPVRYDPNDQEVGPNA